MITISIKEYGHNWRKQNLVTVFKGRKSYDVLKCLNCGIVGHAVMLGTIDIPEKYKHKVKNCGGSYSFIVPQKIKITVCRAHGDAFRNLTPDSEHDVVEPPTNYKNDEKGVWVMGVGEPVKVLPDEFLRVG